jgi:hypothetical protein
MNNDGLTLLQVQSVIDPLERRKSRNRNGSGKLEIKRLGDVRAGFRGHGNVFGVKTAFSDFLLVGINFVAQFETSPPLPPPFLSRPCPARQENAGG